MLNPDSPYIEMSDTEKTEKVLSELGYTVIEFNTDIELQTALIEYDNILSSLPFKKAADALREGISKKTEWIRTINFDDEDKQGRIKFTPDDHTKAIKALASDISTLEDFVSKFINAFKKESTRLKNTLVLSNLERESRNFKEKVGNL